MKRDKKNEVIIHYHQVQTDFGNIKKKLIFAKKIFMDLFIGAILSFIILNLVSTYVEFKYISWLVLSVLVGVFIFYLTKKKEQTNKPSYKIYTDRIEFFNERSLAVVDVIDLNEIDQIRYEDSFLTYEDEVNQSYSDEGMTSQPYIYCYLENGYKSISQMIKNDRIKLILKSDDETEKNLIKILQFFQNKKKQVYISTRNQEIQKALNLKNWTNPGV